MEQNLSNHKNDTNSAKNAINFCVLFDLDNTLIGIPNTWSYFDGLIQDVMETVFKLPVPSLQERNTLWRSGKAYVEILKNWGVSDPDKFWYHFDQLDGKHRQDLIEHKKLKLYDDVIPTLTKLRSIIHLKIGLVTNTPRFIAQFELDAFNLSQYFDEIIGLGDDQMICKPEPDGILKILRIFQGTPDKALYIGDSRVDVLAANRAHVQPLLIMREKSEKKYSDDFDSKDFIPIQSLSEIFEFID